MHAQHTHTLLQYKRQFVGQLVSCASDLLEVKTALREHRNFAQSDRFKKTHFFVIIYLKEKKTFE